MSKNIGWIAKFTAAVSTTFLMACGSTPQKEELQGVVIPQLNLIQKDDVELKNSDPLAPSLCRYDLPDVLTHKDMNPILMGGSIVLDSKASPEEIQAAAKKQFEERAALFQKIFGCGTPQAAEMNLLAQLLKNNYYDMEAFTKLQNMIIVNNYADVAKYYNPEYFQNLTRAMISEELQPVVKSIESRGFSIEIKKVEVEVNEVIQAHYGKMVSMALKASLAKLFGRTAPDDAVSFGKYIEKKISGVISAEVIEQLRSQSAKKPQIIPYYEEGKPFEGQALTI